MIRTGRLSIDANESRLAGTLLALLGTDDPRGAATKFVRKRGFVNGDRITVTGESGTIGEPLGGGGPLHYRRPAGSDHAVLISRCCTCPRGCAPR